MEYVVGSLITLATIFVVYKSFNKIDKTVKVNKIRAKSQSYMHMLAAPLQPFFEILQEGPSFPPPTQSRKYYDSTHLRVIFHEDKAYWIKDNSFLEAAIIDGVIDHENATAVDIMGMNKVQLDKMMFIVEKLTEGLNNDFGNSWDS